MIFDSQWSIISPNDVNFIAVDNCTMIFTDWLQIIQFGPSWIVVASDSSDLVGFRRIASEENCSLTGCYRCISKNTKIKRHEYWNE